MTVERSSMAALVAALCLAAPAGAEPPAWQSYDGHIYALTAVAGNWSEAQAQAEFHGGHLVSINDADENAWVNATFGPETLWIGLYQPPDAPEPAGGWQWTSGEAVTYTQWNSGEPNNHDGIEDYAVMNNHGAGPWWENGNWNDVRLAGWPGPHWGVIEAVAQPPTAAANGPYTLWVGDPLILNASGSADGNNDIVSYEWDLDDDGSFETGSGANAFCVVPYADVLALGLVLDGPYDVHLRVTDATGLADADDSILRIVPEPPTLGLVAIGAVAVLGRRRRQAAMLLLAAGVAAGSVGAARADYADLVLSLDPVAYWRFNDPGSAEGAVAADSSANGLHGGLYHNGVILTTADLPGPGSGGQAASFDGLDDYIDTISEVGFPAGEAERTFTGWVRYDVPQPHRYGAIFRYGNANYEQMYSVLVFNSNDLYTANDAVGVTNYGGSVGTDPLSDGQWHFVAFTCSSSNHRVYLDGEFVRERILWTNTVLSSQAYISDPTQGDSYFCGSMDELALFDRALTDQEIRDLYEWMAFPTSGLRSINANYLDSGFVPTGGGYGLGQLTVADAADIVAETDDGQQTYPGGVVTMVTSLFHDGSDEHGIARGEFRDGTIQFQDDQGRDLLAGDLINLKLAEVFDGGGILAGDGLFEVTVGYLAEAFGQQYGNIVQITFEIEPTDIDDFTVGFTGVSNITVTPVPEPATLGLLALGGLALLRRRR